MEVEKMGLDRMKRKLKKDIKKRRDRSTLGKIRRGIGEAKATKARAGEWYQEHTGSRSTCIDCGRDIPADPNKPRCLDCWKKWKFGS